MGGEVVFLTGGTGHIGFRTLVTALEAGYHVRASVRRQEAIRNIKLAPSVQNHLDRLEFVIVEDITKEGAFDTVLHDVSYILHIASPLARPADDYEAEIIQPAVRGTTSILGSALRTSTIKRVVITSSVAVTGAMAAGPEEANRVYTQDDVAAESGPPYSGYMAAYGASKKRAVGATRDFIATKKPSFTLINIMPTFVIGKNELASTPASIISGTNRLVLDILLGNKGSPVRGGSVHVDDVAAMHVKALDPAIEGNQDFAANSGGDRGIVWEDAFDIARRHFPNQVNLGILPLGGSQPTESLRYSAEKAEKVMGFKFKSYEDQVVNIVEHYVEAVEEAKKRSK